MSRVVKIQYEKCHPDQCANGICYSALQCNRKLIKQESAYEYPMSSPVDCPACGDCAKACPSGAIQLINI